MLASEWARHSQHPTGAGVECKAKYMAMGQGSRELGWERRSGGRSIATKKTRRWGRVEAVRKDESEVG